MNKSELIDAIAKETNLSRVDCEKAINAFLAQASKALKRGDKLSLVGFGTFSVARRSARTGRNPQTGKPIRISSKKVAKFKAGRKLTKKIINADWAGPKKAKDWGGPKSPKNWGGPKKQKKLK